MMITWVDARSTEYERPLRFVDEQQQGPFAAFRHEHRLEATATGTRMYDDITLTAPLGVLGSMAERTFLTRRMRSLIEIRNHHLVRELDG